ncbi:hypothetical protein ACIBHY_54690 [Nonomuraea sp. NPDC050547]|uniref:hypothetical protein n=1 Tax=Nonomuraea sp. NPDC050547 TaxID=3364368 RepID=UPI0037ACAF57
MADGGRQWQLIVLTGGDALRQERLTRDLHNTLRSVKGLDVGFTDGGAAAAAGHKGVGLADVALWASVATTIRPVSQILVTLIKEWCARERHRKVELTYGGNSVTITGRPDAAQERMIRDFWTRRATTKAAMWKATRHESTNPSQGPSDRERAIRRRSLPRFAVNSGRCLAASPSTGTP